MVLRAKFRRIAGAGREVVSDRRYVLIWDSATVQGTEVIDERTGRVIAVSPPAGCKVGNVAGSPLGGPWVLTRCGSGPPLRYELYDIQTGSWRALIPNLEALFASSVDCAAGQPGCAATPVALGSDWVQFIVDCDQHCYAPSYAFQNIRTGQVQSSLRGWIPGGNTVPDLNSARLAKRLCSPLRVPAGPANLPGPVSFQGQFVVSGGSINAGTLLEPSSRIYLERCGSTQKTRIDPSAWPLASNPRGLLWNVSGVSSRMDGLLLPSLRNIVVGAPYTHVVPILGLRHLYLDDPNRGVWSSRTQFPPSASGPHNP